jgi:drug/metabolite transporter (DMT)-like permease
VLFALLSHIIPALFFFKGIRKIEAFIAGIVLLLEPVSATVLASILFGQPIGFNLVTGGFLILISNYLAIQKQQ